MSLTAPHFQGLQVGETLNDANGDAWIVMHIDTIIDGILLLAADGSGVVDGDTSAEFAKEGFTRTAITVAINQLAANMATIPAHPKTVQTPGGLMSWLPAPSPAPAAPPNLGPLAAPPAAQPFFYYYNTTITLGDDKPSKPTRRQVSHNGKDWVDYRHLLDADDFESYTHRREV